MEKEVKVNVESTTEVPQTDAPVVKEELTSGDERKVESKKEVDADVNTCKKEITEDVNASKTSGKRIKEILDERRKAQGTKKLVLVTIEGCESCNRMKKMIEEFESSFKARNVEIAVVDKDSVTEAIPEVVKFEDYPTFVFIKNDKVIKTHKGTMNAMRFIMELKKVNF